jgi:hypothetical protein
LIDTWKKRGKALGILTLFLWGTSANAQVNILGKPGYIKVPSAQFDKEASASFHIGFLPIERGISSHRLFKSDGVYYSSRVGITDYLELSLNFTYHLKKERVGLGDRQLYSRVRLNRESKYWPSIAVIFSIPIESNNLTAYNALTLTKTFSLFEKTRLELTGGYGLPYYFGIPYNKSLGFYPKKNVKNEYLNGFFGGLSWKPVSWLGILADYDTRDFNLGLWMGYRDRVGVQYYLYGLENSGGTFYLKFPLNFKSRELRRFQKNAEKLESRQL